MEGSTHMGKELALGVITSFHNGPQDALRAVRELGIPTVQVTYQKQLDNDEGIAQIKDALAASDIEITTVFCHFDGESYSDIPTVRQTVGLVPEATRAVRVSGTHDTALFAQKLGVDHVAAHIGFIPEDASDPQYAVLVQIVQGICDDLATRGQIYTLETGQETAATLQRFIGDVDRKNLRVNFDPANMILYGNDNPLEALPLLAQYIDSVHCKDGMWPTEENQLGYETPLGEGDVNIPLWFEKLMATGYCGPLTIEREISGEQQKQDILKAKELLEGLVAKHTS
jgi:sugar phosphate isomerase/epimerase